MSKLLPTLSENALVIAEKRYLKIDDQGKPVETPEQMFTRIAKFIATGELDKSDKKTGYQPPKKNQLDNLTDKFYEIQAKLEFLAGMPLLDRGKEDLVAACYVMPIHDSIESIYGTLANTVVLHRRGAGIGYDFSEIRPEGTLIKSTKKQASGPISFMRLYDFSSEVIMNRGAVRHAGHMGILRIDHPDIEKFITAKVDYSQLTNFNISIAVTDEFVKAYHNQTDYELKYQNKVYRKVNARDILQKICESIYKSGEPGFIFIDEINRFNPTPNVGAMTATNQCGEQPLLPYEACNLGSIVLNKFLNSDKLNNPEISADKKINWERLYYVVETAVQFLDNTISISNHLLPQIRDIVHEISQKLGKDKGDFGNFKGSRWDKKGYKNMRNATVTTIAPNGTTSLLADCNGGIEPFFAMAYVRKNMETMGKTELLYINKFLEKRLRDEWLYDQDLMKEIASQGTVAGIAKIPERIKNIFISTYDIQTEWHLKTQSAFQKYTDNDVSKTINLKSTATITDIIASFKLATQLKLKGLTIYRDKSRDKQVLNIK